MKSNKNTLKPNQISKSTAAAPVSAPNAAKGIKAAPAKSVVAPVAAASKAVPKFTLEAQPPAKPVVVAKAPSAPAPAAPKRAPVKTAAPAPTASAAPTVAPTLTVVPAPPAAPALTAAPAPKAAPAAAVASASKPTPAKPGPAKAAPVTALAPAAPAPKAAPAPVSVAPTAPAAVAPAPDKFTGPSARKAPPLVTTIEVRFDAGFGNYLSLRGEGAGLDWDIGQPLECRAADLWVWTTDQPAEQLVFKVLLNDAVWSAGENFAVRPGERAAVVPSF